MAPPRHHFSQITCTPHHAFDGLGGLHAPAWERSARIKRSKLKTLAQPKKNADIGYVTFDEERNCRFHPQKSDRREAAMKIYDFHLDDLDSDVIRRMASMDDAKREKLELTRAD